MHIRAIQADLQGCRTSCKYTFKMPPSNPLRPAEHAMQGIAQHLQQCPELLPQLMTTLFEIVLFDDCSNQWSLSRPMLALILVNEPIFNNLKQQVCPPVTITFRPARCLLSISSCYNMSGLCPLTRACMPQMGCRLPLRYAWPVMVAMILALAPACVKNLSQGSVHWS